ncbi:MAG: glycosyltransferase family 2 protein, partial [Litoreibacter sp.]|nr:glycosyltransferase family 2 protein [Litoreibacter sp.]
MSDVRLITVTFNSSDVIGPFLDSVPDTVELVVVDNASSDDTVQKVRANGSALIELPENLGFGTACNKGAAGAKTPYLFFVNPDARLEPGCIEVLVAAAEKHPKAGAFNPAILSPSGDVRLNRRSCILPRALWTDKALASSDPNISTAVHMLSGAALFCRRDAYEEIDGFDPNIFLYHEDDDLSVRMAKAGWQLRLEHSARVTHIGGAGSGNSVAAAAFKAKEIARSRLYVERK